MIFNTEKRTATALLMALTLVAAALAGVLVAPAGAAPGDWDDPIMDDTLLTDARADPASAYNTTHDDLELTYTMGALPGGAWISNFTAYARNPVISLDEVIYRWNNSDNDPGAMPDDPIVLDAPMGMMPAGHYTMHLEVLVYNGTDSMFYWDYHDVHVQLMDGTNMIRDLSVDGSPVVNDGENSTTIHFTVNRSHGNISSVDLNLYHPILSLIEGSNWVFEDNLTMADLTVVELGETHTNFSYTWDVPLGQFAGLFEPSTMYTIVVNVSDVFGYSEEVWDDTLLEVEWMEVPPVLIDGRVEFNEDTYKVVDLNDLFFDYNEDPISYYINMSEVDERLHVEWVNDHTINVSAAPDFNGEIELSVWVNDTMFNETENLTIAVLPVDDDLMVSEDNTIMVNEVEMWSYFDAGSLFVDPDGPVNLTVSIGYEEVVVNDTSNETEKQPIWHFEEGNISVEMNETQQNMSKAMLLQDFEEGSWEFPIAAWIDGEWVMNGTAFVEVDPVNDVPTLAVEGITFYYDEIFTANLADLFYDPDSTNLSFIVDTTAENLVIDYNETTHDIAISVENNWTGNSGFEVNVSDGEDYNVVMIPVEVQMHTYTLSGVVDYEDNETHGLEGVFVTLMVGETEVPVDNVTGEYSVELVEGEYSVSITLGTDMIYDEEAGQSGYIAPELDNMTMDMDKTLDISIEWMEYTESAEEATWEDIDFDSAVKEEEDDTLTFAIPVKNESRTGYGDLKVYLIIYDDEEEWEFNFTWIESDMEYTLEISEDQMDDLPEGKLKYKYSDKAGNETSEMEYTFRDEKQDASLVTVIVLIVLIILVLIALVFIMRKPSEEFDEEEEEEEEGERVCPSCGETIADEEAVECPYCGESLEEE